MTGGADGGTFLGRAVPPSFVRTVVVIAGHGHPYRAADWADAIVAVEHGEVLLEGVRGGRILVRTGDVLWLAPTPLRALRSGGASQPCSSPSPAVLLRKDVRVDAEEVVRVVLLLDRPQAGRVRVRTRRAAQSADSSACPVKLVYVLPFP